MSDQPVDPRWPRLVSLAVHELRTPMTVVAGYVRMLLQERAGPLDDMQRKLLTEAEKSCARLSALLAEMSDLGHLESGQAAYHRAPLDLRELLTGTIARLPPLADREVVVTLDADQGPAVLEGDSKRLEAALGAVISALRRELVTSDRLVVRERARPTPEGRSSWIAIADEPRIESLAGPAAELTTFDEWRGGCGLSLAIARRVLEAHGGTLRSPAGDSRAGAAISLPLRTA
jgi:signal transduction histidine kinase